VQIVAPGGVGKTQLVKKWREKLLGKGDRGGAARAFDWSFYSQGTQQQASADEFFDKALRWFGETEMEKYKDPWAKGERLAQLVNQQSTLLILDGLEPLQHPPGPLHGELSDPSLQALLRGLNEGHPGLCVVTTREAVPDLAELSQPRRVTVDLNTLADADGAKLLKLYGVTGSDEERQQASADVEGHALALILLGTYLKSKCGGDVARRSEALLFEGHERYAAHAHKVMASYVTWFEREDDVGRAAACILRLMGLFNRPADPGCLAALRAEPPIPGLTAALFAGDRDQLWDRAAERLQAARLLADDEGREGTLDAHPLVREHFADQLAGKTSGATGSSSASADPDAETTGGQATSPTPTHDLPAAAREAHRRLYEHLKQSAPELPDNLNDMLPLFHALAHGCKAGFEQPAMDSVYFQRIARGNEAFAVRKLGAFGSELNAISCFFDRLWTVPSPVVTATDQAWILHQAGFLLRALGRTADAVDVIVAGINARVFSQNWLEAGRGALNLSELSLTAGDVSSAVRQGEQSVELVDRSGDAFLRVVNRTALADALHASGRMTDEGGTMNEGEDSSFILPPSSVAHEAFREAEAMQQEMQPQFPLLYSLSGYRYCDLLLESPESRGESPEQAIARIRRVRNRAEKMFEWRDEGDSLLDVAMEYLTLGRTYLLESRELRVRSLETEEGLALDSGLSALDSAEQHLNESVSLLRQAGHQDFIARGLLHRAALWRALGEGEIERGGEGEQEYFEWAERDLAEGELIAERGSMLRWQIEAALERTRLALSLGDREEAGRKLEETRALVKQTEKPYEPHVPDWEDWQPPAYVGVFEPGEIVGYHRRNDEIAALQAEIDRVG
jgi:hypothetical protein